MMTSNSNPTPQKGQEIENSPERNPCPEIPDPAFEQASIIRNAPSGDEFIFVKLWLEKICDGDIDAALMLQGIINVCDLNPERVEGVEVYVDMHLLSSSPFGVRGNDGEIVSRLNKLQSLGLIAARPITKAEWLGSKYIRELRERISGHYAEWHVEHSGPCFALKLEVARIEEWLGHERMPHQKGLFDSDKNPIEAKSDAPLPAPRAAEVTVP